MSTENSATNDKINELDDQTFVSQFESQTLSPRHFNHIGHLRISWLYLAQYDLDTAVSRVCSGIQTYATFLGATDKFHLTVTDAVVRIMAARITYLNEKSWSNFLAENRDLVDDAKAVLAQYFSAAVLADEKARVGLVSPDLQELSWLQ